MTCIGKLLMQGRTWVDSEAVTDRTNRLVVSEPSMR
jgi:hypothetical protein